MFKNCYFICYFVNYLRILYIGLIFTIFLSSIPSRSTPVTLPIQLLEHSLFFLKTSSPVSVTQLLLGVGLALWCQYIRSHSINQTNSPCPRSCQIPNSPSASGAHLPPSMLGLSLTSVCTGLVRPVTTTVSSYEHLPCGVQKTVSL